ncbi:MAG: B12-binding domain-containing radical SAM protein [Candidatus Helarchaeota archaeon]
MKVLLLNPPYTVLSGRPCIPYNILTVGSYLDKLRHEVRIYDMLVAGDDRIYRKYHENKERSFPKRFWKKSVSNLDNFKLFLKKFNPDVIGISISLTETYYHSKEIIRLCNESIPNSIIVVGGNHATFNINELFKENNIDIVIKNDGRRPLELILSLLEKNELTPANLKKINNIAFKLDEKIVETEFNKSYLLNYYPINYDLINIEYYKDAVILLSLICPYKCPFCSAASYYNPNYTPPLENIMDEIEFLVLNNIEIGFGDNTFTLNKKLINQLFNKIKERKLEFEWKTTTRIDQINDELLEKMKKAGCKGLLFGIETLHDDLLEIINKYITFDQIEKAIKLTRKFELEIIPSFILGLPFQTKKHLFDQCKKMDQLGLLNKNLSMGWLVPFKGTEFYNNSEKYKLSLLTNNYYFYSFRFPVIETPYLSFSQAIETFEEISSEILKKIDFRIYEMYKDQSFMNIFLDELIKWRNWWVRNGWNLSEFDHKYLNKLKNEISNYKK